jgi:hypothetical protein
MITGAGCNGGDFPANAPGTANTLKTDSQRDRVPNLGTGGPGNTTPPKAELLLAEHARRE